MSICSLPPELMAIILRFIQPIVRSRLCIVSKQFRDNIVAGATNHTFEAIRNRDVHSLIRQRNRHNRFLWTTKSRDAALGLLLANPDADVLEFLWRTSSINISVTALHAIYRDKCSNTAFANRCTELRPLLSVGHRKILELYHNSTFDIICSGPSSICIDIACYNRCNIAVMSALDERCLARLDQYLVICAETRNSALLQQLLQYAAQHRTLAAIGRLCRAALLTALTTGDNSVIAALQQYCTIADSLGTISILYVDSFSDYRQLLQYYPKMQYHMIYMLIHKEDVAALIEYYGDEQLDIEYLNIACYRDKTLACCYLLTCCDRTAINGDALAVLITYATTNRNAAIINAINSEFDLATNYATVYEQYKSAVKIIKRERL